MIKSLFKDYIQKSRIFLYPALGIKRGGPVKPIETYLSWEGQYAVTDAKFCCLYLLKNDDVFKNFEDRMLLNNKLFYDFKLVEDKKGVYIFDMSSLKEDWDNITNGKYSQISIEYKKKIRHFIGLNDSNLEYVDSFLYPAKHFKTYSELMHIDEDVLKSIGELCSKPDLEKECLKIKIQNLNLNTENCILVP